MLSSFPCKCNIISWLVRKMNRKLCYSKLIKKYLSELSPAGAAPQGWGGGGGNCPLYDFLFYLSAERSVILMMIIIPLGTLLSFREKKIQVEFFSSSEYRGILPLL